MADGVKLVGAWISPYSRMVELALKLKKVEYEFQDEDLSNKSPLLLQSNPVYAEVPVLIHNGKPIMDSRIILEYIDEVWPEGEPLLPKDPCGRAAARFWASFVHEKIVKTATSIAFVTGEECENILEEVRQDLEVLQNQITDKEFFGGDAIGFLDVVALFIVYYLQIPTVTNVAIIGDERFQRLKQWLGNCSAIDVVRELLPPLDVLHSRIQPRMEILRSTSRPA